MNRINSKYVPVTAARARDTRSSVAWSYLLLASLFFFLVLSPIARAHFDPLPDGIQVDISPTKISFTPPERVYLEIGYTNKSTAPIRFLTWGTALEGSVDGDLLKVTVNGLELPYLGPKFRRAPPGDNDYIILSPGQRRSTVVAIDQDYAVSRAGEYQVTYRSEQFLSGLNSSNLATFRLSSDARRSRQEPLFFTCTEGEAAELRGAVSFAESISRRARDDIRNTPVSQRPNARRYQEWFGSYDVGRWNRVQQTFDRIASAAANQRLSFTCGGARCRQGVAAYVFPNQHYDIFLCTAFWRFSNSGSVTKGGVVVHELSHFSSVGNTDDFEYGRADSVALADRSPGSAVYNADSYLFFAENSPPFPMPTGTDPPSPVDPTDPTDPTDPGEPGDPIIPVPEPEPVPPVMVPILDLLLREEP